MSRVEGRSAEDTRRGILLAAARVVRRKGPTATLGEVAFEAGVSKGGLLYHFASKAALTEALARDLYEEFGRAVMAAVEPGDDAPGRLLRGYIRANFAEAGDTETVRDVIVLAAHVMGDPELAPIAEADARRWHDMLAADGLPAATVSLVIAACDGVSAAPLWGSMHDAAELRDLESHLIALTRR